MTKTAGRVELEQMDTFGIGNNNPVQQRLRGNTHTMIFYLSLEEP